MDNFTPTMEEQMDLNVERKLLIQVFPEEIWCMIFQHHAGSVDLRYVAQASKYFEELLYPYRAQWLFFLVWQIIAAKLVTRDRFLYLQWFKNLFILRLVCKNWNKAVDQTFEETSANIVKRGMIGKLFEEIIPGDFSLILRNRVLPGPEEARSKFLRHFKNTHPSAGGRSPLVSKTVDIINKIRDATNPHTSWPGHIKLLSTYGHFVKHCSIEFIYYDILHQCLTLMPNLESVAIFYAKANYADYDQKEIEKWSSMPLPVLPKLSFLKFDRAPQSFGEGFIAHCSNLSGFVSIETELDIGGLIAHPLKELRFCVNPRAYTIMKAQCYSWPLTELELNFLWCKWDKNWVVEWPELFDLLHRNWNKTLRRLTIALPGTMQPSYLEKITNWSCAPLLKLELLTHLTLTLRNFHALDFILPLCDTLEYLSVRLEFALKEMQSLHTDEIIAKIGNQTIKLLDQLEGTRLLRSYATELVGSNIWQLFPKLKEVRHRSDTRNDKFVRPLDENNVV